MELINKNKQTIINWYNRQHKPTPPSLVGVDTRTATKCVKVRDPILKYVEEQIGVKPVRIVVNPVLVRNLCHINCDLMLKVLNKNTQRYKQVLGYVITSCGCNEFFSLELHSVLVHIPSNEYIDLTTDWCGELVKYFIPFKDNADLDLVSKLNSLGCEWFYNKNFHRCKVDKLIYKTPTEDATNELDKFMKLVDMMSQVVVIRF